jgi:hypothetical protein
MVELITAKSASIVALEVRAGRAAQDAPPAGLAQAKCVGHQRDGAADQSRGYGDAVRPGHRRLHQVRDCRRGVVPMYAQASRPDVSWNTRSMDDPSRGPIVVAQGSVRL